MKSKIIILITLGILFALLPIITVNLSYIMDNSNKSLDHNDDFTLVNENLKISAVSGIIHIDNNWSDVKTAGIVTGEGTYFNPYIIEDLVIDGRDSVNGILIENSNEYFKIENCSVYNTSAFTRSISIIEGAGINLQSVSNGLLINNNVSNNKKNGIYLYGSSNNTVSGNIVGNYNLHGIHLRSSDNNTISGNAVDNNSIGIHLSDSDRNTVSANTANNNFIGMYIWISNNTTISGNTADNNNESGIHLRYSDNTTISGNSVNNNYLYGIHLSYSDNTKILGNTANNNNENGIYLSDSNNTTISINSVNNNYLYGIHLRYSDNTTISGNTANNNYYGVALYSSNYNIVTGNILIGNDICIFEADCHGNVFENNNCERISFELIILISVISGGALIGVVTILLIRRTLKGNLKIS